MQRIRLGDILLQEKLTDKETLEKAHELQIKTGDKLGRTLIKMGVIKEEQLLNLLSRQLNIPFVDINHYNLKPQVISLLPEIYARRYNAIILENNNDELLVGMTDPMDINAIDSISKILKKPIKIAVVSEASMAEAFDRVYRRTQEISHFAEELSGEIMDDLNLFTDDLFNEAVESDAQAPVVKLLNSLFRDAIQARASDIHIEPDEKSLRIRFRIDGILNESILDDKRIASALIQRLKLKAHLDISEHRIPQDGRFNFNIKNHSFDVRVATLPTANGEAVVMRLLDQTTPIHKLEQLGLDSDLVSRLEAIYSKPYGMLLVTGPTGSGKTTTLYSILSRINLPETKIITVEDPVEYRMPRINQVQVNPKIDLTFARILRAILRQDPDIIMVGEIRDTETARIAMRAAVTGHLVFATLHTNDALSSALRLIDMGAEGYMVASAVKAILGQRLIRTICTSCIRDHTPTPQEQVWLDSMNVTTPFNYKVGEGCSRCGYRGYRGRLGIYELLELNTPMLDALRLNNASLFAKAALASPSYQPLAKAALKMVEKGETSVQEAIRVVGSLDEEFQVQNAEKRKKEIKKEVE